jgi:hypothetical protein
MQSIVRIQEAFIRHFSSVESNKEMADIPCVSKVDSDDLGVIAYKDALLFLLRARELIAEMILYEYHHEFKAA